ncbi:ABC transporter substrate-binding protein [Actinomadura nitritigenes]|uniref:ABC transporter substrate-binding protein n=1 Tax=Actinomadura nitritigenes TaxID=134602 RepID=A0ABS3RFD1_9ACTN|nr:ABC transporter substrate-binding protein [Actinomadura nitritigenes]MBO2444949.1 ABC transporter substrate-binding protein [Actinomadura nitritigenes]
MSMSHRSRVAASAAAAVALALSLTNCSTRGGGDAAAGVDKSTIKLGVLVDLSGPLAGSGKTVLQAHQMAVEEINKAGGVCGRRLELVVRDDGYDPQKAVTAYDEVEPQVVGFLNIYGSAVIAALRDKIDQKGVLSGLTSFSSALLGDEHLIVMGSTYDIQMINGVDWLVRHNKVKKGDKVGHIYLQGDFGGNSYKGSTFAAKQLGLTLIGQQIKPTDSDLTSQVNALKAAGVKAVLIDATSKQTASAASVMKASGLNVPIMGNVSSWGTSILSTSAKSAMIGNYQRMSPMGSLGGTAEANRKLAAAWKAKYGATRPESDYAVVHAYTLTHLYTKIISGACDDLSRSALVKARSKVKDFEMPGLLPPQDLSDPAQPTTRQSQVQKIDPAALAGLGTEEDFRASATANAYKIEPAG